MRDMHDPLIVLEMTRRLSRTGCSTSLSEEKICVLVQSTPPVTLESSGLDEARSPLEQAVCKLGVLCSSIGMIMNRW